MAAITTRRRKALPKSQFALPGQRKYPIDTRARAANAKARASAEYNAGRISKATRDRIFARANKKLGKKK